MSITASITFYNVVVAIHVLSVVIAFGVTFVYPLVIPLTIRTAPDKVAWLHRMQGEIGKKIIAPTGGIVLIAGIYLAAKSPQWDFKDWWVGFGIVAILVLEGLGGAFFSPREEKLAELAERDIAAAAGGEISFSAEYQALGRQVGIVGSLASLLVAVAVIIMVLGARGSFL
jgi:hypothetical protein